MAFLQGGQNIKWRRSLSSCVRQPLSCASRAIHNLESKASKPNPQTVNGSGDEEEGLPHAGVQAPISLNILHHHHPVGRPLGVGQKNIRSHLFGSDLPIFRPITSPFCSPLPHTSHPCTILPGKVGIQYLLPCGTERLPLPAERQHAAFCNSWKACYAREMLVSVA